MAFLNLGGILSCNQNCWHWLKRWERMVTIMEAQWLHEIGTCLSLPSMQCSSAWISLCFCLTLYILISWSVNIRWISFRWNFQCITAMELVLVPWLLFGVYQLIPLRILLQQQKLLHFNINYNNCQYSADKKRFAFQVSAICLHSPALVQRFKFCAHTKAGQTYVYFETSCAECVSDERQGEWWNGTGYLSAIREAIEENPGLDKDVKVSTSTVISLFNKCFTKMKFFLASRFMLPLWQTSNKTAVLNNSPTAKEIDWENCWLLQRPGEYIFSWSTCCMEDVMCDKNNV